MAVSIVDVVCDHACFREYVYIVYVYIDTRKSYHKPDEFAR